MKHAILERKLLLSLHMKGKNLIHWIYCIHITNVFASTFQIASTPQLPLPSFTAAQSARMCRSNLSEMATIVLDSDLIPKKPNNRNHFEHLFCAPVVLYYDTLWFPFTSHLLTCLWYTMLLCSTKIQDARNQSHPYLLPKWQWWMLSNKRSGRNQEHIDLTTGLHTFN